VIHMLTRVIATLLALVLLTQGIAPTYAYAVESGRLAGVVDALNGRTTYGYDEVGNKVRQTDALGRSTYFNYDSAGRLIQKKWPGGQIESKAYRTDGLLDTMTDASNITTTMAYDSIARLTSKSSVSNGSVGFGYDSLGRRSSMTRNGGSSVTSTFDATTGRLSQLTTPTGNLVYGYEPDGSKSKVETLNGKTEYQYDNQGRVTGVGTWQPGNAWNPSPQFVPHASYTYDAAGQLATITRSNNITTTYSYDLNERVIRVAHSNISSFTTALSYTYTYDAAGRRTSITKLNGQRTDYSYDGLGRLVRESYVPSGRILTYTYDAVGNRVGKTDTADPSNSNLASTYVYNYDTGGNDWLLNVTRNGTTVKTFTYDNAGRTASINGLALTWTFDDKLASYGSTLTFSYDADGNRIGKSSGGISHSYVVDPTAPYAQVIEQNRGGTLIRFDVGMDGMLIRQVQGGVAQFVVGDALESNRGRFDATGNLAGGQEFEWVDAFGKPNTSAVAADFDFYLNGQQLDPETGLYFLRARYMDPDTGRFLSRDPFEGNASQPSTLHRYRYANNDPVNITDPSGNMDGIFGALASMVVQGILRTIQFAQTPLGGFTFGAANGALAGYTYNGHVTEDDIMWGGIIGMAMTRLVGNSRFMVWVATIGLGVAWNMAVKTWMDPNIPTHRKILAGALVLEAALFHPVIGRAIMSEVPMLRQMIKILEGIRSRRLAAKGVDIDLLANLADNAPNVSGVSNNKSVRTGAAIELPGGNMHALRGAVPDGAGLPRIHPDVEAVLRTFPGIADHNFYGKCTELQLLSEMLYAGEVVEESYMVVRWLTGTKRGQFAEACDACKYVLRHFKVECHPGTPHGASQ
jgi:RHS repeat-associated protein